MAARTTLLVHAALAGASALGIILVGAASVLDRRTRRRGTFAFALFCLAWGLNLILANAGTVALDPVLARRLLLLSLAALLPAPYFLVELAASQDPSPDAAVWNVLRGSAVAIALAAAAALVLTPDLVFKGFYDAGFALRADWGPVRSLLVVTPFFAAFGLALFSFARAKRASPTPRTKRRVSILLAGLGLYLGYAAGNNLTWFVVFLVEDVSLQEVVYTLLFGGLTVLVAWIGVEELRASRRAPTPGEARRDRLVAGALLVPLAWGGLEAGFALRYLPSFKTAALWRLAGVGVLAYGFARWRVFDLPERTREGLATGAGTLAAGAGGGAAYLGTGALLGGGPAPIAVGLLAAGAGLLPSVRLSRDVLGPDHETETRDDRLYQQRIDSYRAAVESAMARGMPEDDEAFLEGLRDRYGITPEEDRVVRYYARNAVVGIDDGADASSYERLRLLGEGGEGRTWLARDRNRERLVVLKEPLAGPLDDPALRREALEEARAARKVNHPNVVTVEEVVDAEDGPVIVMEHVEGGSLADLLETEGPLDWERTQGILVEVLAGLSAVHRAGLVHRDVKPSNVLLTADGTAKLADFGVATRRPDAVGGDTLQDPDATVGTRGYVAPEVEAGDRADEPADVYGAGALLHTCLLGSPPEPGEPVRLPEGVPSDVGDVLTRALSRDPDDRFPSADAMREAVESAGGTA